ncbi:MAG: hypothetical protein PHD60_03735 [Clostridia bacterium]|nr:hypothetical protein [Clostridia bacterium]
MKTLEDEFSNVAIMHLDMNMYYPKDALLLIRRCKELNKKILGIDAFIVDGEKIQPSLEHSIDFSIKKSQNEYGFWEEAENFIKQITNDKYVFEIVFKT